jgi:hypothetical protein
VLARSGEDRQAVLGVCQVDLGQSPVEVPGDLGASFAGDGRIGLQLSLGLGDHVAQPDVVLGVVGIAPVGRRQYGDRGVGPRAPQLGKGRWTQNALHDRTIERIHEEGIWGNRSHSSSRSEPQELPSGGSVPYSRKASTLPCTHLDEP